MVAKIGLEGRQDVDVGPANVPKSREVPKSRKLRGRDGEGKAKVPKSRKFPSPEGAEAGWGGKGESSEAPKVPKSGKCRGLIEHLFIYIYIYMCHNLLEHSGHLEAEWR